MMMMMTMMERMKQKKNHWQEDEIEGVTSSSFSFLNSQCGDVGLTDRWMDEEREIYIQIVDIMKERD